MPDEVCAHPAAIHATRVELPDSVLLPGLVNAHTHLDLTHIGPQLHDPAKGFVPWVDMIRANRLTDDAMIEASVQRGIELSRAGGTVAIGDISGAMPKRISIAPYRQLSASGMRGVSFIEFFGIGTYETSFASMFTEHVAELLIGAGQPVVQEFEHEPIPSPTSRVKLGLQPHAPNTVDIRQYQWTMVRACLLGWPVSTHLAESVEEREFVARATGPQRELLERFGIWDEDIAGRIGHGLSPVQHLAPVLELASQASTPMLLAHVNNANDEDIQILADSNVAVAYCPRASDYFGAHLHFGPHRYRDMLNAGIPVALGTDSIVNLPDTANDATRDGMSIFDEMRLLHSRDNADPLMLLQMATVHGARALGLDPSLFIIRNEAQVAGIIAVRVEQSATIHDAGSCLAVVLEGMHPCRVC
ncbi:MAG: amidohydrolase family protein [Phycisphaeraceae bacterium]|nr:amidohydrolase family protein [Phycisphaerales bacterium]MCB9859090.1 amidohydrolase family protein [Phycisphaeraceae bacterium]